MPTALLAVLVLTSGVDAQPPPPHRQPTTTEEQAHQEIAASIFVLLQGIVGQDRAVVSALCWCDGDTPTRAFADAHAHKLIAACAMESAVFKTVQLAQPDSHAMYELFDEFDLAPPDGYALLASASEYRIDGDRASVEMNGQPLPSLRKVNGVWKMDVTPTRIVGKPADAAPIVEAQAKALEQLTKDTGEGKFKSVADVRAALEHAGFQPVPAEERRFAR